jgi:ABC-type transport system involved in cytochrome bd biosynthesis fused ATPase/permease subunit
LISHRFSTARLADRILVLENGTLLESGTQDLLKADGRYAELLIYKQEVINNKMIIFLKNLSLIKLINKHKLLEKETEYFLLFLYCLSIFCLWLLNDYQLYYLVLHFEV